MNRLINNLKNHLINIRGFKLNRKVVLFESDDWGSIRTVQPKLFSFFEKVLGPFNNPYLKYDTIASKNDLYALFEVLSSIKNEFGFNPVITLNTVVANPDFLKIKSDNFSEYYYESFTETLNKYYPNENVFSVWKEGINEGLIFPQFHGREHVNVPIWLRYLHSGHKELLKAFDFHTWSTTENNYNKYDIKLQASLDYKGVQAIDYQTKFIKEGLDLFKFIFGFQSKTMIPNNYILPENLHSIISDCGVEVLQGMKYQVIPFGGNNRHVYKRRIFGYKDSYGLVNNVRNCIFEPSQTKDSFDDVGYCLSQIENAFYWGKPAVISTHRLNFIGSIVEQNRTRNLKKFKNLLLNIIKKWPNVHFISSDNLVKEF